MKEFCASDVRFMKNLVEFEPGEIALWLRSDFNGIPEFIPVKAIGYIGKQFVKIQRIDNEQITRAKHHNLYQYPSES